VKIGDAGFTQSAAGDQAQLVVDDFVRKGSGPEEPSVPKVETADASVGTPLPPVRGLSDASIFITCQSFVDAASQTDAGLLPVKAAAGSPAKISSIQTKAKNQLILDRAIEDELMETIQTMDQYVAVEGLYRQNKNRGKEASRGGQSEAGAPPGLSLPLSR
jgi:hypothetical protein